MPRSSDRKITQLQRRVDYLLGRFGDIDDSSSVGSSVATDDGEGGTSVEVVTIDASGGTVTEQLPAASDGDTVVAVRVDTASSNTATLEVQDPSIETIERLHEQGATFVDLAVEEALYLTYSGGSWYQVRPPLRASAEPVTTDQATKDSPSIELVGAYDEEGGSGVTSARVEAALRHEVTGIDTAPTPSEPTSRVRFEIAGMKVATLDDAGNFVAEGDVSAFGSDSGSGSSGFVANDPVSLDTTVDPTEINFVQDVKGDNGATVVQGPTEIQFKGSGLGGVSNPSGSRVEVEITGGNGSGGISDVQDNGTSVVSDADTLDFGTGLDVTNPTTGEAEVDVNLTHSDLSDINSDDHHTPPSAGDGLSESSNVFMVNESQVNHNSLNQYVANQHIDHSTVSVSAGDGLSGGGNLTTSRTLSLSGPLTDIPLKTAGDNLEWQVDGNNDLILQNTSDGKRLLTIDQDRGDLIAEGDVSAFGSGSGSGGGGTEFEAGRSLTLGTQDPPHLDVLLQAGANVTLTENGSGANATYEIGVPNVQDHVRPSAGDGLSDSNDTFIVNESQVDHDSLNQYVGNEHIDHSSVSVSAGTALSGGGDLTSDRTLSLSGPLTGVPFKTQGDDLEWQANADNDLVLKNTTDDQVLLTVDQNTGSLTAEGDVAAFGSGTGGGGGTTFEPGRSLSLDSATDPDTLNVNLVGGTNVTLSTDENDNYVIDASGGSGAVDSVFGRTGAVAAQSGDYDHSQLGVISPDDHHTRYTDSEARGAVRAGIDYVDFKNNERSDYSENGRVYWDKSAGLYVKSSNASHTDPALLWSSANFMAATGISVSYDDEDHPSLAVDESEVDHNSLSGISSDNHHARYDNAEAVSAVNEETSLSVDITGDADSVDGYDGNELAALSENETVAGIYNFKNGRKEFGGDLVTRTFAKLTGNDSGNGVFTNGYRAYVGLIPLINTGDKELVYGRITGARGTYSWGGGHFIYAENDPYNDGLDITLTSGIVTSLKGADGARLVQFDYEGFTWVGIEIVSGGSGISQGVRFQGRVISDSGNEDIFPQVVDFGSLSNLAAFSGSTGETVEEVGSKTIWTDGIGINTAPSYSLDAAGQVRAQDGLRVTTSNGDYEIQGDGNGNLKILTPSGNRQKFFNDGDIGAFK